jgi:hypothetical protein
MGREKGNLVQGHETIIKYFNDENMLLWEERRETSFKDTRQSACATFQVESQVQIQDVPKSMVGHSPASCL